MNHFNRMMSFKKTALLVVAFSLAFANILSAQDSTEAIKPKKVDKPVRSPFEVGVLMDNQTIEVPSAKTLEFVIQHRFGKLNSGTFDLIGLYAPANMRLGVSYCPIDHLQIGIGTTKNHKLQDLNWKWSILRQTRSGSIPIAITYFGDVEYDASGEEDFGIEYKTAHRVSYEHQLLIARKFNSKVTTQIAFQYSHFNQVDSISFPELAHDNFSVSLVGRVKVLSSMSVIFEYDYPLTTPEMIKPNIALGVEFATSAHAFQIFLGSFNGISYQENSTHNTNDFTAKDILLGFNITRAWNF